MSAPAAISPPSQASVLYIPLLVRDDYGGTGYQWLDAVTGGQVVAQGDETHQSVDLPFPFTFYGNTYTTLWVSSNGFVNFGAGHSFYANSCLPSLATPNNAIYAFWDDLAPTGGSNGNIYFKTLDVNTFVVEWYQVKRYDSDDRETFEIVLRRDGSIKLQYQSVSSADSATVGIENATGTTAQQHVCNGDGAPLADELVIRYTTP